MNRPPRELPATTLRDRESTGLNRARLALELRRAIVPLLTVLALAVVAAVTAVILLGNIATAPWGDYYRVRIVVNDAKGVVTPGQQDVRLAGVTVGEIADADLDDGRAVLTLSIDPDHAPLYRDARLRLRPGTPLQDMYLNIESRGTRAAGELPEGGTLAADRTRTPVDVSRVLGVFDRPTRERFEAMIDEFGRGLDDRGEELRAAFVELAPFLGAAQRLTHALAVRRRATSRLVHNLRLMMDELARRDRQVTGLVTAGQTTFAALDRTHEPLERLLAEMAPMLSQLRSTSHTLDSAFSELDPALVALRPTVDALDPALEALTDFSRAGRPAFSSLRRVTAETLPLLREAEPLATELERAFTRLRPAAPRLDRSTSAILPCRLAIRKFFQLTPSVFKFGDPRAAYPRGAAVSVGNDFLIESGSCVDGGGRG